MFIRFVWKRSIQRKIDMKENGFSSIQTMLILLILSFTVLGLGTGISMTQNYYQKNDKVQQDIILLEEEIYAIINQLEMDPAPESDSMDDPVWSYIKKRSDKYVHIELTDVSSRINLNWVRPVFFERTELKKYLLNGVSPDMLKDHRNEIGYIMDINLAYSELIAPGVLGIFFTPYSYLNVNTAYEYALKDMYEIITGDSAGGISFHSFIAGALSEKHIITEEELSTEIGQYYNSVYPVISVLPEMNIHFIPEFILKQVLSYPYGGEVIKNSSTIFTALLSDRDNNEISPVELRGLIETEGLQERVFHHLGTKTWFWKVEIATEHTTAEAIIICFPDTGTEKDYSYELYSFIDPGLKN